MPLVWKKISYGVVILIANIKNNIKNKYDNLLPSNLVEALVLTSLLVLCVTATGKVSNMIIIQPVQ